MRMPPEFRPRFQPGEENELLTPGEAAGYLRISIDTLRFWRRRKVGRGPRYIKAHRHRVVYRRADLDRFIESRAVQPPRHRQGSRRRWTA